MGRSPKKKLHRARWAKQLILPVPCCYYFIFMPCNKTMSCWVGNYCLPCPCMHNKHTMNLTPKPGSTSLLHSVDLLWPNVTAWTEEGRCCILEIFAPVCLQGSRLYNKVHPWGSRLFLTNQHPVLWHEWVNQSKYRVMVSWDRLKTVQQNWENFVKKP